MKQNTWTKDDLLSLYRYKHDENKSEKEVASLLKKTQNSVHKKYPRVDWDSFLKDPDTYLKKEGQKKWTRTEMAQLNAFLESGKSYDFIAEKLGRTFTSVERQAQSTDWQAWKLTVGEHPEEEINNKDEIKDRLVNALVRLSRHEHDRLKNITEEEFTRKISYDETDLPIPFNAIKEAAKQELDVLGFGNPELVKYGPGTYIIVGDSHGKWTKTNMFNLLKQMDQYLKPSKIIHIGHLLDDDNDISYNWGMFSNLVIVSKIEELRMIQDQRNKFNFKYDVVRGGIQLGSDLLVMNQDIISDYVKNPISNLDSHIFDDKVIVNCHRLELMPKCSNETTSYFASPGCVCEKHVNQTIKQIDFDDQKTVKQAFYGGFSKYRRMQHMYNYWNQGVIVLNVSEDGNHTIVPCLIRKMGKSYVTSYFDKMITTEGIKNQQKKIFVAADTHSPNHDCEILDLHEQICKDYAPDVYVNVGDIHDFRSLNHHMMDRGITITENILDESAKVHLVLKRMATWAKERHLIYGNHERFSADFVAKFPQFGKYLDFRFLCGIDNLGYQLTSLKNVLKIGSAKFLHGDLTMYGQPGNKVEKVSRTFGENTFVGHIHYASIRFGSYSIGLSGKLDQDYNEPMASTWVHGMGFCNQFEGKSWLTTIPIVKHKCFINNKIYTPKNPQNWNLKKYKVKLQYEVE